MISINKKRMTDPDLEGLSPHPHGKNKTGRPCKGRPYIFTLSACFRRTPNPQYFQNPDTPPTHALTKKSGNTSPPSAALCEKRFFRKNRPLCHFINTAPRIRPVKRPRAKQPANWPFFQRNLENAYVSAVYVKSETERGTRCFRNDSDSVK